MFSDGPLLRSARSALTLIMVAGPLTGCAGLNNVTEVGASDMFAPRSGRAVVLYGVGLEASWPYRAFSVDLQEYDMQKGRGKGDCWRYNHTNAVVEAALKEPVKYFAFAVEPGYFVHSAFSSAYVEPPYDRVAFKVLPGRINYIGDFILTKGPTDSLMGDARITLARDIDRARAAAKQFATLQGEPILADTAPRGELHAWLCMP